MPGGLLDMFGIDPVTNRNNRREDSARERMIAAELSKQKLANEGQLSAIKATGGEDRLTATEKAKFDQILQKMVTDGQMSVEQARTAGQIANTRAGGEESRKTEATRGTESRKTQAESATQAKDLENTTSGNKQKESILMQQLGVLGKSDIPFSPQNLNVYDQSLSDPRIRAELQRVNQMTQARQDPGFAATLAQGLQAQNLAPAFANVQAGKMNVGAGDMTVAPPSGVALPPTDLNQWNRMQGSGQEQTVETPMLMYPGMKEPIPGQPKITSKTVPGRIAVNPQLLQQAASMGEIPGGTTPQEDPIMQMLQRLRMSQNGGTNLMAR